MTKGWVGKCRRCKTWEIVWPYDENSEDGGFYVDGFKTWEAAMKEMLRHLAAVTYEK